MSANRKIALFSGVLLIIALFALQLNAFSRTPIEPEYIPGKLLVKFRQDVDEERIRTIVGMENGTVSSVISSSQIHIIEIPRDADIPEAVERFSSYSEVLYAEPVWRTTPLEEK
jgi:hypothetical protein